MNLKKLVKPKSIAIIGASEKEGFGRDTTINLLKFSDNLDRVYLVNPGRDTVFERKCYKSISEINDNIDLCIICTPQKTVIPLLQEASKKGCGGAVVFASGERVIIVTGCINALVSRVSETFIKNNSCIA